MSHFARINENNVVIDVQVGVDSKINEGHDWFVENLGGTWIKTSYNTRGGVHILGGSPYRKNYAGIGYTYDAGRDAFIAPKTFESWSLNEDTCQWEPPTPMPTDDKHYTWNEETTSWVEIN